MPALLARRESALAIDARADVLDMGRSRDRPRSHQILTRHGVIPIVRVYKTKDGGVPDRILEKTRVKGNTRGLERVDIRTFNGAPHVRQIAVDGATQLHPSLAPRPCADPIGTAGASAANTSSPT